MAVFVPTPSGYRALTSVSANASYNDVREHLGYNSEQTYS
jgi:hypothetical protein